jgi:hypothetical protein
MYTVPGKNVIVKKKVVPISYDGETVERNGIHVEVRVFKLFFAYRLDEKFEFYSSSTY